MTVDDPKAYTKTLHRDKDVRSSSTSPLGEGICSMSESEAVSEARHRSLHPER